MSYTVKEIFLTLQGEGIQSGRVAIFCRFSGCNLWSGRESDRATAACRFCDTNFVGSDGDQGGRYATAAALVAVISALWGTRSGERLVVCTGGEPLLQLDRELIDALHQARFAVAVETNGTVAAPAGIDWLCVSPKGRAPLVIERGDELKLVYPQPDAPPEQFIDLPFRYHTLQPLDDANQRANIAATIAYCLDHPRWRLGLQSHKMIGIR